MREGQKFVRSAIVFVFSAIIAGLLLAKPLAANDSWVQAAPVKEHAHYVYPHSVRVIDGYVVFIERDTSRRENWVVVDPFGAVTKTVPAPQYSQDVLAVEDDLLASVDAKQRTVTWTSLATAETIKVLALQADDLKRMLSLRPYEQMPLLIGERLYALYNTQNESGLITVDLETGRSTVVPISKSVDLSRTTLYGLKKWNDRLVVLGGRHVYVVDQDLQLVAKAPIEPSRVLGSGYCGQRAQLVVKDRLVYESNCGDIVLFNLEKMQVERVIPRLQDARFHKIVANDTHLFVVPEVQNSSIHVINMENGKLEAVINKPAAKILAKGDKLAIVTFGAEGSLNFQLLQFDNDKLADRAREVGPILSAHASARQSFDEEGAALYAVKTMQPTLVDMLHDAEIHDPTLRDAGLDYGRWLVLSFAQRDAGISLLEKWADGTPNGSRARRLLAAAKRFDEIATKAEEEHRIPSVNKPIDYGAFPGKIFPYEDKIYIGRYHGITDVAVYDRQTLGFESVISIFEEENSETQDSVMAMAFWGGKAYVGIESRQGFERRDDLAVVDLESRSVEKSARIMGNIVRLYADEDQLVACNGGVAPRSWCARFKLPSLEPAGDINTHTWTVYNQGPHVLKRMGKIDERKGGRPEFISENYAVSDSGRGVSKFQSISLAIGEIQAVLPAGGTTDRVLSLGGDQALYVQNRTTAQAYGLWDLSQDRIVWLFEAPIGRFYPRIAVWNDRLLVGFRNNLLGYNLKTLRFEFIQPDFIPADSQNEDQQLWGSAIERLFVDQDRLIVLTRDGTKSRVVNLPELFSALDVPENRLPTIISALMEAP